MPWGLEEIRRCIVSSLLVQQVAILKYVSTLTEGSEANQFFVQNSSIQVLIVVHCIKTSFDQGVFIVEVDRYHFLAILLMPSTKLKYLIDFNTNTDIT